MKKTWKRALTLAAATLTATASLALAGCGGNATTGSAPSGGQRGDTLTLGVINEPTTWAASGMEWGDIAPFAQAVYDGLLRATPKGQIKPWLATSYKYNAAKTVLTMQIRKGVKFTDGSAFNAAVAAQNLLRFRDGTSSNASKIADIADAKATGDYTLQITLKQPDPALLWWLTTNPGLQESAKAFANADVKTVPVGSGAYVLDTKDTVPGSSYVFTRNKHYWAPADVHYNKLVLKYFSDPTAILNAIQGGQVNGSTTMDNTSVSQIKAAGYTINANELNWQGLDLFDRAGKTSAPLGNVKVRQAINYALDRKGLLQAAGNGFGTVTTQIFPPSSDAFVAAADKQYPYNVTKAKQLMSQAGYADGFTLSLPEGSGTPASVYALITQQLGAIGIKVQYTNVGDNQLADVKTGKFPAALMGLSSQPNVSVMWALDLTQNASWNPFHFDDPKLDALYEKVVNGSATEAKGAAQEMGKYIVDQAYFAPWYRPQLTYATDAGTKVEVQQGNAYPYIWNFQPAK